MIDIFSKYASAVPVKSKESVDVIVGVMECIKHIGKKPKRFYSDHEKAFESSLFQEFCEKEDIKII